VDGKPKARVAATETEARSGMYRGDTYADKTVRRADGTVVEGHSAMRLRDVFGFNGPLNYAMSAVMNCFKTVFFDRFAFTFMTTTAANKEEKLGRFKYVVGSDVKTMDKTVPRWFCDYFHDRMTRYLDEGFVRMMKRCFQAPWVAANPWHDTPPSYNPTFGKPPTDPTAFENHPGLPSGIAYNPIYGRAWMVCNYVCALARAGILQSPGQVVPFLEGKLTVVMLNSADDAVFATDSPVFAEQLRVLKSPYAILEPETPVIYLGDVLTWTGGRLRAYPNPQTYLSNMLARERGISDPRAQATGFLLRSRLYSAMPSFAFVNSMFEELAIKELGVNPRQVAESIGIHTDLSDADTLFALDPNVIYYKVDPRKVSKALLDSAVSTVPASDWFSSVRHLFKVPVQEPRSLNG